MKPVLISTKKTIGKISFILLLLIFTGLFWYIEQTYSLLNLLSTEINISGLPDYMNYVFIVVCAFLLSSFMCFMIKRYQIKKLKLVVFSINLAVDGSYHYVQAPSGILSSDFLKLFFKYLIENSRKEKYSTVLNQYFPLLEIRRSDNLVRFSGQETLSAGGLKDGDICQIVGKPKQAA